MPCQREAHHPDMTTIADQIRLAHPTASCSAEEIAATWARCSQADPCHPYLVRYRLPPMNLRQGATVIKWKPDFTYDTLRKGCAQGIHFVNKSGSVYAEFFDEPISLFGCPTVSTHSGNQLFLIRYT